MTSAEQRREHLPDWEQWNREAVVELGEVLRHEPPELLLEDPRVGLMQLDELTRDQDMESTGHDSAVWVESRLHAYVAHYLITKFDGHWLVGTDPDSPTFGRYLVAVQHPDADAPAFVDVGDLVHTFLHSHRPRSLAVRLVDLEISLVTADEK